MSTWFWILWHYRYMFNIKKFTETWVFLVRWSYLTVISNKTKTSYDTKRVKKRFASRGKNRSLYLVLLNFSHHFIFIFSTEPPVSSLPNLLSIVLFPSVFLHIIPFPCLKHFFQHPKIPLQIQVYLHFTRFQFHQHTLDLFTEYFC